MNYRIFIGIYLQRGLINITGVDNPAILLRTGIFRRKEKVNKSKIRDDRFGRVKGSAMRCRRGIETGSGKRKGKRKYDRKRDEGSSQVKEEQPGNTLASAPEKIIATNDAYNFGSVFTIYFIYLTGVFMSKDRSIILDKISMALLFFCNVSSRQI